MDHRQLSERIRIDPAVCGGKPWFRGHRLWLSLILDDLADGRSIQEILAEVPRLSVEDLRAAWAIASEMTPDRTLHIA